MRSRARSALSRVVGYRSVPVVEAVLGRVDMDRNGGVRGAKVVAIGRRNQPVPLGKMHDHRAARRCGILLADVGGVVASRGVDIEPTGREPGSRAADAKAHDPDRAMRTQGGDGGRDVEHDVVVVDAGTKFARARPRRLVVVEDGAALLTVVDRRRDGGVAAAPHSHRRRRGYARSRRTPPARRRGRPAPCRPDRRGRHRARARRRPSSRMISLIPPLCVALSRASPRSRSRRAARRRSLPRCR